MASLKVVVRRRWRAAAVIGAAAALSIWSAAPVDALGARWRPVPAMSVARLSAASAVLPDGDLLVVGGLSADSDAPGAERFDLATRTWSRTGGARAWGVGAFAVTMRNGRVLVGGDTTDTAIFDPRTDSWTPAGQTGQARRNAEGLLLRDGRVLVIGGQVGGDASARVDIYDPRTGTWRQGASMISERWDFTATRLSDGRVLVAGGLTDGWSMANGSAVEIYDPRRDSWTAAAPMGRARHTHAAVRLRDGRVMVMGTYWNAAGGGDDVAGASTEVFDPRSGTWTATAPMATSRAYPTAHLLPSGQVLVIGGKTSALSLGALRSVEQYDPVRNQWRNAGQLPEPHVDHVSGIHGWTVVVAGGSVDWWGHEPTAAAAIWRLCGWSS